MRYSQSMTTAMMLNQALADPLYVFEINKGEKEVSIWIAPNGVVNWYVDDGLVTEQDVAEVLARWAVEGVKVK